MADNSAAHEAFRSAIPLPPGVQLDWDTLLAAVDKAIEAAAPEIEDTECKRILALAEKEADGWCQGEVNALDAFIALLKDGESTPPGVSVMITDEVPGDKLDQVAYPADKKQFDEWYASSGHADHLGRHDQDDMEEAFIAGRNSPPE